MILAATVNLASAPARLGQRRGTAGVNDAMLEVLPAVKALF